MRWTAQDILYEDQAVIVCRKRPGVAVQTARLGEPDMETALKNYLKGSYVAVIHRLDQPVEGILVFARTKAAAAGLSGQNKGQMMHKEYYAAVQMEKTGRIGKEYRLVDYLKKMGKENLSQMVPAETEGAKRAELSYEIIKEMAQGMALDTDPAAVHETGTRTALIRIRLKTGRHHQIRVQLANVGMPLLGDRKYGSLGSKAYSRERQIKDIALCAYRLAFIHPMTEKEMEFEIVPSGEAFQPFFPINS